MKEELINEYFREVNKTFHDVAQAYAFLKGGTIDNLVLYTDGERLLGGGFLIKETLDIARIEYLLVPRELQGNGYGNKVLELMTAQHKGMIYCYTRDAAGFYKKNGFHQIGEQEGKPVMARWKK